MNNESKTDWAALEAMTDEQAYINAMNDPDNPPNVAAEPVALRKGDGATVLERFRKAIERRHQNKVLLSVRYDADVVEWYRAKGKGYQSIMNAALRACMEAEMAAASRH